VASTPEQLGGANGAQGGMRPEVRAAGGPGEGYLQGHGGPWYASHLGDPSGPEQGQRHPGGGRHCLGLPMEAYASSAGP
jgi:hypothetical protein